MTISDLATHRCSVVSVDELFEYFGGHYSKSLLRKYVREGALLRQQPRRPTRKVLIATDSARHLFLAAPSAPRAPRKPRRADAARRV